jgi:predicted nucleic acid-binding protein
MRSAFLDTVGLIALWDARDQWHSAALTAFNNLRSQRIRLFTSDLILMECANATSRTNLRQSLVALRDELLDAGGVFFPDDQDITGAWEAFRHGSKGQPGVVDNVSFILMRRFHIKAVLSNDIHFKAAGFTTLF